MCSPNVVFPNASLVSIVSNVLSGLLVDLLLSCGGDLDLDLGGGDDILANCVAGSCGYPGIFSSPGTAASFGNIFHCSE